MLMPWLIIALADPSRGHPASAGRLKAAAMQLLPALLDSLHARSKRTGMRGVQMEAFVKTLVGPEAVFAGCSRYVACLACCKSGTTKR